jgi:hypothetical protein
MLGAELINLVMNLVSDPEFIILFGVIENSFICHLFSKFVDNFNRAKINQGSVGSSTRYVVDLVSLDTDLEFDELLNKGDAEMITRLS